jgi:hypothetical protein
MTRLIRKAAFTAVLTVAGPVWAQVATTAEELNRQELNRLATTAAASVAAAPAITYSIGVAQRTAVILQDYPQLVRPNFKPYEYPFAYLYPYYGYQYPNIYAYIYAGSSGYYRPIDPTIDWGWRSN